MLVHLEKDNYGLFGMVVRGKVRLVASKQNFGTIFFEQTKQRYLAILLNSMLGGNQTQNISTNISYQVSCTVVEG